MKTRKELFVEKAKKVHGDLYDYSKTEYINNKTKILIIDPDYGEFWQTPSGHLASHGHPKRGLMSRADKRRHTSEWFITRAREVHGDLYDYSRVDYVNSYTKVLIIDPEYGEFWQLPTSHLRGQGNPRRAESEAGKKLRLTLDDFISRARAIHGDLYDYSKVNYVNSTTKVLIIDPDHGEFWQSPSSHLLGSGNPKRSSQRGGLSTRLTTEEFIKRSKETHGDLYDYTKSVYVDSGTKVCIIDPEYGEFWQKPVAHMRGANHPLRGRVKANESGSMSQEEFVTKAIEVHSGLYDYSRTIYRRSKEKVLIIDPEYGEFWQTPNNHLGGSGHPKRSSITSKIEDKLSGWLGTLGVQLERGNRTEISPYEIDLLLRDSGLGIEVDGVYWHSDKFIKDRRYHQKKQELAEDKGIELLQFWDFEVDHKFEIVTSMISHKLGLTPRKISARKTSVTTPSPSEYREFLRLNHLQGPINSSVRVGLSYEGDLVSVMGLSNRRGNMVMDRFASLLNTTVTGALPKMISRVNYDRIITHSANRYATGGVYKALGFTLQKEHPYTLYYTDGQKIYPREKYQRHKLKGLSSYSDDKDTQTILNEVGVRAVYAAGTKTWVLER